jgi:ATP synthase protein I
MAFADKVRIRFMAEKPDSLQDLSRRLDAARQKNTQEPRRNASAGLVGLAYRLTIEIIAAIGVSGFIGWWIDKVLETKPVALLIMLFLGVAAGIANAIRTVNTLKQSGAMDGGGDAAGS